MRSDALDSTDAGDKEEDNNGKDKEKDKDGDDTRRKQRRPSLFGLEATDTRKSDAVLAREGSAKRRHQMDLAQFAYTCVSFSLFGT
jgi:hypothetical protein